MMYTCGEPPAVPVLQPVVYGRPPGTCSLSLSLSLSRSLCVRAAPRTTVARRAAIIVLIIIIMTTGMVITMIVMRGLHWQARRGEAAVHCAARGGEGGTGRSGGCPVCARLDGRPGPGRCCRRRP
eukprot:scaffold1233_cov395-Prasinococcus_capsulatus_cf.AAC.38